MRQNNCDPEEIENAVNVMLLAYTPYTKYSPNGIGMQEALLSLFKAYPAIEELFTLRED